MVQVIVCGGGPVGLVTAVQLARAGIEVLVLERELEIPPQAKATHFASPAVLELQKAGVLDDCRALGFSPVEVCWRDIDLNIIGSIGFDEGSRQAAKQDPLAMVCIPQHKLAAILIEHSAKYPNLSVKFGQRVTGLTQTADSVTVVTEVADSNGDIHEQKHEAEYVVGADGGRSAVRKLVGQHLDGYTWEDQIVATNIVFPFHDYGIDLEANFIVHPEHMVMFAKMSREPEEWRVTYGEETGFTDEELRDRHLWKMNQFMPKAARPITKDSFKLNNFAPYKIHQRCVAKMRVGRVCLAGDCAHLVNPFGGTGLTSGMIDGGGLADCLIGVFKHGLDPDFILDKYCVERRKVFETYTNPVSTANKARMRFTTEEILADPFIAFLRSATPEQLAEGAKMSWALQHDFTQYYPKKDIAA